MGDRGTQYGMVILALALGASTATPAVAQVRSSIASVQLTVTKAPGATLSELPRGSMPAAGAARMDALQREVSVNVPFTLQVRTPRGPKLLVAAPAGAVPLDSLPQLLAAAGHSDTDGPIVLELVLNAGI